MKQLLTKAFTDPSTKVFFVVNDVLAFFTIISILGLILETVPSLEQYTTWFNAVEFTAAAVFTLEYAARLWITKPWYRYTFSFYGVIDVAAIIPTFIGLGNFTFLKSARVVRLIRFLRLVRLVKLSRLPHKEVEHSFGVLGLNVAIYVMCLLFALLIFGVGLYLAEPTHPSFVSIPTAMWWSLKVFMGSIPVSEPFTQLGEVLYVAARFVGLLLLGVMVGVVGNIFRQLLLRK